MFTVCNSSKARLISFVYHLIISCEFSWSAARHLDARILQCSGSICPVFRLLSITSLALFHGTLCYFLKPLTRYNSRHCSVLFGLLPRHWPALFNFAISFVTSASLSVVILVIFFLLLQCDPISKTLDQPPLSFVDNKLKWVILLFKSPVKKGWDS